MPDKCDILRLLPLPGFQDKLLVKVDDAWPGLQPVFNPFKPEFC